MSNKLSIFAAGLLILVILGGGAWLWFNYQEPAMPAPDDTIVKYELQTHEYFEPAPSTTKYRIDSDKELQNFYALYSDQLNVNTEYLQSNDLFVEVRTENSGSVKHTLESVNFDNNKLSFNINTTAPEIGTDDMAFWYFVAVIPKEKAKQLDTSDWFKPSEVLKQ